MRNVFLVFIIMLVLFSCKEKGEPFNPLNSTTFAKMYGNSKLDNAYDMKQTDDGGYIIVGSVTDQYSTATGELGNEQFYVVKIDMFGNIQWDLTLGDSATFDVPNNVSIPLNDVAKSVQLTSDGNFIIAGTKSFFEIDTFLAVSVYTNMYLVKLDKSGTIIAENDKIGFDDINDEANSVVETNDGGYVLIGSTERSNSINPAGTKDGFVIQCDANLQPTSNFYQFGGVLDDEYSYGFNHSVRFEEGIVLIGKRTNLNGNVDISFTPLKVSDLQGVISNEASLGGDFDDVPGTIIPNRNEIVMIGTDGTTSGSDSWLSNYILNDKDFVVQKINTNISNVDGSSEGNSVCVAQDNTGYVVLSTFDNNGNRNMKISFVSNNGELDPSILNTSFGFEGIEEGKVIIPTSDGGYAILGNTRFGSDQKMILLKLNEEGKLE